MYVRMCKGVYLVVRMQAFVSLHVWKYVSLCICVCFYMFMPI